MNYLPMLIPPGLRLEPTPAGFRLYRSWAAGFNDYLQEILKVIVGLVLLGLCVYIPLTSSYALATYLICLVPTGLGGLGLIYHALVHLFDTGVLEATPQGLSYTNGPLPIWWIKNVSLPLDKIQRFDTGVLTYGSSRKETANAYHTYDVVAFTGTPRPVKLVAGLYDEDQAAYITEALRRYLADHQPEEGGPPTIENGE